MTLNKLFPSKLIFMNKYFISYNISLKTLSSSISELSKTSKLPHSSAKLYGQIKCKRANKNLTLRIFSFFKVHSLCPCKISCSVSSQRDLCICVCNSFLPTRPKAIKNCSFVSLSYFVKSKLIYFM